MHRGKHGAACSKCCLLPSHILGTPRRLCTKVEGPGAIRYSFEPQMSKLDLLLFNAGAAGGVALAPVPFQNAEQVDLQEGSMVGCKSWLLAIQTAADEAGCRAHCDGLCSQEPLWPKSGLLAIHCLDYRWTVNIVQHSGLSRKGLIVCKIGEQAALPPATGDHLHELRSSQSPPM